MVHKPINYKNEYHKYKEEARQANELLKKATDDCKNVELLYQKASKSVCHVERSRLKDAEFYVNKIKSSQDWVFILSVFLTIETIFILIRGLGLL